MAFLKQTDMVLIIRPNWENYNTVMIGDSFGIGECVDNKNNF